MLSLTCQDLSGAMERNPVAKFLVPKCDLVTSTEVPICTLTLDANQADAPPEVRISLAIMFPLLLTWNAISQVPGKLTVKQIAERSGVVQIGGSGQPVGSGFLFGPQNDVVTCWHVKFEAEFLLHSTNLFFLSGTNHYQLTPKYSLPKYDIAVFTPTPEIKVPPSKSGDFKKLRPGDILNYAGYDSRQSSQFNFMTVVASSQVTAVGCALNDDVIVDFLEFPGIGIPGYSGGAVFNLDGDIVAVMREAWTKKGVKGGDEILINRAFSIDILSVLNGQLFKDAPASTNRAQIGALDFLMITNK